MQSDDPSDTTKLTRRSILLASTSLGLGSTLGGALTTLAGCDTGASPNISADPSSTRAVTAATSNAADEHAANAVVDLVRLGSPPWQTFDPFLFCVHHKDDYPLGNASLGPNAALDGRNIGQDFGGKDGWSMYHGDVVPGFPRHPHRGFETVTITRRGHVDHSDSLGATARYGNGDVQWMTAGSGIVHAEMFPLLAERERNPIELFQIWLNLPALSKFAQPYFSMFWDRSIPRRDLVDARGRHTRVTLIAGELEAARAPAPPPDSWAARADADVAIWSIQMEAGAVWQLPKARASSGRTLYFFAGDGLQVDGREVPARTAVRLRGEASVELASGSSSELLLLQGRPIGEPVIQHGPFVMSERTEIEQAVRDYQRTQFGGWPWPKSGPVHARDSGRFARHADGRVERA